MCPYPQVERLEADQRTQAMQFRVGTMRRAMNMLIGSRTQGALLLLRHNFAAALHAEQLAGATEESRASKQGASIRMLRRTMAQWRRREVASAMTAWKRNVLDSTMDSMAKQSEVRALCPAMELAIDEALVEDAVWTAGAELRSPPLHAR